MKIKEIPTKKILKRTKIVATLGPASESYDVLTAMVNAGLNVARFNFSHGAYAWHKKTMQIVRDVSEKSDIPIALLADLQGPRIRTVVENNLTIKKGDVVRLFDANATAQDISDMREEHTVIVIDCPDMVAHLTVGNDVMIEDGLMTLRVTDLVEGHAILEVVAGGTIKNHKGVNIPDAHIPLPTVTPKDIEDLTFALEQNVDYIALSFVREAKDIINVRTLIKKLRGNDHMPKIIAKIERKEAMKNLDAILGAVDGVMVARGDLGIEADPMKVVLFQKDIIAKAMAHMRPVIVATQMLASMEHNPRPTRAEVADVTNAVIDHTDAVMLSAETTVGTYPIETVDTMAQIAYETELSPYDDIDGTGPTLHASEEINVAKGAYQFAREMDATAIVMYSETGYTARVLSHFRPERLLLVATNNARTYRQLSLVWGIMPFYFDSGEDRRACIDALIEKVVAQKILFKNDLIVTVLGSTKGGKELKLHGSRVI